MLIAHVAPEYLALGTPISLLACLKPQLYRVSLMRVRELEVVL